MCSEAVYDGYDGGGGATRKTRPCQGAVKYTLAHTSNQSDAVNIVTFDLIESRPLAQFPHCIIMIEYQIEYRMLTEISGEHVRVLNSQTVNTFPICLELLNLFP